LNDGTHRNAKKAAECLHKGICDAGMPAWRQKLRGFKSQCGRDDEAGNHAPMARVADYEGETDCGESREAFHVRRRRRYGPHSHHYNHGRSLGRRRRHRRATTQ